MDRGGVGIARIRGGVDVDAPDAHLEGVVVLWVHNRPGENHRQVEQFVQSQLPSEPVPVPERGETRDDQNDVNEVLMQLALGMAFRVVCESVVPAEHGVEQKLHKFEQLHVIGRLDQHRQPEWQERGPKPRPPNSERPCSEPHLNCPAGQAVAAVVKVIQRRKEGQNHAKRQLAPRVSFGHDAAPIRARHRHVDHLWAEAQNLERIDFDRSRTLPVHVAVCAEEQEILRKTTGQRSDPVADPRVVVRPINPVGMRDQVLELGSIVCARTRGALRVALE
mmetsp:Transcript_92567/g.299288  ORF Transcript_92567/g.299288 Transcript_92567/m.299288 type:complete len:278 (-) Transcript_92567:536-1369(-)